MSDVKEHLEHRIAAAQVARNLNHRPDEKELEQRGIAASKAVAPKLQSVARHIEHQLAGAKVSRELSHRTDEKELEQRGIAASKAISPSIQGIAKKMEFKLAQMYIITFFFLWQFLLFCRELSRRLKKQVPKEEIASRGYLAKVMFLSFSFSFSFSLHFLFLLNCIAPRANVCESTVEPTAEAQAIAQRCE
jgi:hypothetical protein